MTPRKMRAEIARRFPRSRVQSTSSGLPGKSVAITAPDGTRLAIMYASQRWEKSPDEIETMFRGWLDEDPARVRQAV